MFQSLKKMSLRAGAAMTALAVSGTALANTTGTIPGGGTIAGGNAFDSFRDTVLTWAKGPLGTGLAVTMMLMGAGMGVARNSPMPALSGIAGAAFLNWGPGIIQSLTEGALI